MEELGIQINKEGLNKRDGVTSSYTDLNDIGLFTNNFRHKMELYNEEQDEEQAIVSGMMFTDADVETGYDDASDLMFLNEQELVIHREEAPYNGYHVGGAGLIGVLLLLVLSTCLMAAMLGRFRGHE